MYTYTSIYLYTYIYACVKHVCICAYEGSFGSALPRCRGMPPQGLCSTATMRSAGCTCRGAEGWRPSHACMYTMQPSTPLIEQEKARQRSSLVLIASENFTSLPVIILQLFYFPFSISSFEGVSFKCQPVSKL